MSMSSTSRCPFVQNLYQIVLLHLIIWIFLFISNVSAPYINILSSVSCDPLTQNQCQMIRHHLTIRTNIVFFIVFCCTLYFSLIYLIRNLSCFFNSLDIMGPTNSKSMLQCFPILVE